jgi:CYTH domain-containing protein
MATENERKYVLYNTDDVANHIINIAQKKLDLRQGYLIGTAAKQVRLRETIRDKKQPKHEMTVKFKTRERLIEIETKIEKRDYDDLALLVSSWLSKTRYVISDHDYKWEIDFFFNRSSQSRYLIMAEVEMPEGDKKPSVIPSFISDNLLYAVPHHNNSTYSSKKLSDPVYATKTYQHLLDLLNEGKDGNQ